MTRPIPEIIAHIRAVTANPAISTTLIQTEDLTALCDAAEHIGQDDVTTAAGAIIDIWMGGDKSWRSRLDELEFLESADWINAIEIATAVLKATHR